MSTEIKDEDKDYYNSSDFKSQIDQLNPLNIESSSEDNHSSSKEADFYDDLLDKEHAQSIHEAIEDIKLENEFLMKTFLILSIQFAAIFLFCWIGFYTEFNDKFIQSEGEKAGIFFPITGVMHVYWYWITRFNKDDCRLIFHNFIYIILFIIYFYLLSDFIDANYVLTVEALILLNSMTLTLYFYFSNKFNIYNIMANLFVVNVIGMIPFSFTLLKKGGVIASISSVDIGIILFFIFFISQIKYKNIISWNYCMNFKNKDFTYSPLLFNLFIHWCISAFAIGLIFYYIGLGIKNCSEDPDCEIDIDFDDDDEY